MSDQVVAITGTVPYRDHFQQPVGATYDDWQDPPPGFEPEQLALNLPLNLDQAMELHWRVKKWKITISGRVIVGFDEGDPIYEDVLRYATFESGEVTLIDDDTGDEDTIREANTREAQLVQGVYDEEVGDYELPERWVFYGDHEEQGGSGEGSGMVITLITNMFACMYIDFSDEENPVFYPSILVGNTYSRSLATAGLDSIGGFTLRLSSGDIVDPLGSYAITSSSLPDNEIDILMEAVEWWPYKTSGGLDVYGAFTGEIENDPFS